MQTIEDNQRHLVPHHQCRDSFVLVVRKGSNFRAFYDHWIWRLLQDGYMQKSSKQD